MIWFCVMTVILGNIRKIFKNLRFTKGFRASAERFKTSSSGKLSLFQKAARTFKLIDGAVKMSVAAHNNRHLIFHAQFQHFRIIFFLRPGESRMAPENGYSAPEPLPYFSGSLNKCRIINFIASVIRVADNVYIGIFHNIQVCLCFQRVNPVSCREDEGWRSPHPYF